MEHFNFNYNVAINTINCIDDIDFTYHIIRNDYPILHSHDDYYEFTILLEGEIINIRNENKEYIQKNTLFIGTPNEYHLFKKTNQNIKILNILGREDSINELINLLFPENFLDFINKNKVITLYDETINLIYKNIELVNSLSAKDWKITNSLLKSTITIILNSLFLKYINETNNESNKYKKIIKKLNDLKSNPTFYTLDVNDLCYKLGYSRTHLNRIFSEIFNESPHVYLIKCKMEYAASLLLHTDYSISEISSLVGYTSSLRFSHNFKQFYSLSPFKYRG